MRVRTRVGGALALASATLAAALVLAACGSSDSESTSAGGTAAASGGPTNAEVARYEKRLNDLYQGTYEEPTADAPKPEAGKNVWLVSAGQNIEASQLATAAARKAAAKLGWNLTVFDGRWDSTRQLQGVDQALADGADGIVTLYIDCAVLKTGLRRAEKMDVPVVSVEGLDCDPPLFAHNILYAGNKTFEEFFRSFGQAQAAWAIAKTKGEAKAIVVEQTDLEVDRQIAKGHKDELEKCRTCEIVDTVGFVGTDIGPLLQAKIEQSLIEHPDANVVIPAYDGVMTGGGAAALRSSGRLDELEVAGGEGGSQGIKQIYDGSGMESCVGMHSGQELLGGFDALVRIFGGQDPSKSNTGIGLQVCDKDHNLPPEGQSFQPPYDFEQVYFKHWGVDED